MAEDANRARHDIAEHLDRLPTIVSSSVKERFDHLRGFDERVTHYDRQLPQLAREYEVAQRIQTIQDVGPITRRPSD